MPVFRNEKIGYIPQEAVFLPHFTVLENILLPRAIQRGQKIEVRELSHSGTSVIVATHDARGIKYGDRLYTMYKGKLLPNSDSDYGGL